MDLAERAGDAFRRGRARSIEAAQAYLEAGPLLVEAKAEYPHGQWQAFLERADIPYRSAARTMQIAHAHMDAPTLAELGIWEASAAVAKCRKLPAVADSSPATPRPGPAPPALTASDRAKRLRADREAKGLYIRCRRPAARDGKQCEDRRVWKHGCRRRPQGDRGGSRTRPPAVNSNRSDRINCGQMQPDFAPPPFPERIPSALAAILPAMRRGWILYTSGFFNQITGILL